VITAKKSRWFRRFFHFYNTNWLLRRSFYNIHLKGHFPQTDRPLILIANHSSWWDGLISFYLSEECVHHDSYAMMAEEGISAFPFFRKIGAFSVNPSNPRSLIQSLNYARTKLIPHQAVWMFPQGAEEHLEKRPLGFKPGVAYLLEKEPEAIVVPITYYYTFRHEQRPELFIEIGPGLSFKAKMNQDRKELTTILEHLLTSQLDNQKQDIVHEKIEDYSLLIRGIRTVSGWIDTFKKRWRNH
jgi:1-acyl-sn-glycerol-3-phosphate acyltransferase